MSLRRLPKDERECVLAGSDGLADEVVVAYDVFAYERSVRELRRKLDAEAVVSRL